MKMPLFLLFRHSAMSSTAQEDYLVTRLQLPHEIMARLHVHKTNAVIRTPETVEMLDV